MADSRAFETNPKPLQKSTISSIAAYTKIYFWAHSGPMADSRASETKPKPLQKSTISSIAAYTKIYFWAHARLLGI